MTHELKIQKQWADAKLAGEKPFEIRRNDRGFQKGDTVRYRVVDPKTSSEWRDDYDNPHPLEQCEFLITYVIEGKDGLEKGYCVYADVPVLKGAKPNHDWPISHTADGELGFETMHVSPVSADLRAGATPSNGTETPLAPPSPLAEIAQ